MEALLMLVIDETVKAKKPHIFWLLLLFVVTLMVGSTIVMYLFSEYMLMVLLPSVLDNMAQVK